ncbi:TraR/DksA family transcriptional regulator [Halomonas sp. McH1-25]|uniref:TraR/DksA family transcriptional regulator n=1 Tax=unclassified Halomonas TaxID=2609666 RepID=UPI001EF66BA8|nr:MULTISPECIES: TraR/DksA family transcriptional regulator [unclassified Halomonas]MCG7600879.1 TraR/DksA family transcriptional regulator [Halomonas sp. McH1-25]MCP1341467.1 TraR/DksA family transcriptional regulator [Halomonas sp. FL8]MCP1360058.1 TraR/DksA family transcriptional regulator [Halomonas sp. BBD45]MCP1364184.1 TraR/DksA family transcriptional regulator [Halomonas sp. BBD48]
MTTQERRAKLEELRADLQTRIQRYQNHQHRTNGALDKDLEEQALEIQNDEVVERLEDEAREELSQVERALARIDAQVGDRCEECGDPIAPGRLEALPYTTRCKDCANL